jgi:hypothetical protein
MLDIEPKPAGESPLDGGVAASFQAPRRSRTLGCRHWALAPHRPHSPAASTPSGTMVTVIWYACEQQSGPGLWRWNPRRESSGSGCPACGRRSEKGCTPAARLSPRLWRTSGRHMGLRKDADPMAACSSPTVEVNAVFVPRLPSHSTIGRPASAIRNRDKLRSILALLSTAPRVHPRA